MQTITISNLEDRPSGQGLRWSRSLLHLIGSGILAGRGCHSTSKSAPSGFAAVRIADCTPAQISYATVQVFREKGYLVAHGGLTNLVFEKKAGEMSNIAYGNWLGDTPVWERVKADIMPVGETVCQLECTAFLIRDKGGATEEEIRLSKLHRGPYQKLLEQVAGRVKLVH